METVEEQISCGKAKLTAHLSGGKVLKILHVTPMEKGRET